MPIQPAPNEPEPTLKKKIGSDVKVYGNAEVDEELTVTGQITGENGLTVTQGDTELTDTTVDSLTFSDSQFRDKVIVTDSMGTVVPDDTISINDIHALDGVTSNIQQQIDDEIDERTEQDGVLDEKIDQAVERLEQADETLQSALDTEIENRADADDALQSALDAEIEERAGDVENLEQLISQETERATGAEEALDAKIEAETSRAESAEEGLQSAIESEASDRQQADSALGGRIDTLDGQLTQEIANRESAISAEQSARTSADETLQSNITAEEQARISADNVLSGRIDTKRDKVTISHGYPVAYTQSIEGNESQTNIISGSATGDSLVARTSEGTIVASSPQEDYEVATKYYVDSADIRIDGELTQHVQNTNNPHNVQKSQVGLGQVENYPMDSTPMPNSQNYISSGAVAQAIGDEETARIREDDAISYTLNQHMGDTGNPHQVTKEQVNLGDVQNYPMDSTPTENSTNYVESGGVFNALGDLENSLNMEVGRVQSNLTDHESAPNPHNITKTTVGLSEVENYPMDSTPISGSSNYITSGGVYDETNRLNGVITGHIQDTENPHHVTKSQVGLGDVDNTSDLEKPISNATQSALDDKVDKIAIDPSGSGFVKIDVNSQGQVTGHYALDETDIPQLSISKIANLQSTLDGKATENHASTSTTYGVGDATNYGHVKMDTTIGDSDRTDTTISESGIRAFVNSSISTNTANYISDNGNPFTDVNDIPTTSPPVTNNDYAVVVVTDAQGNKAYDRYKATVDANGNVTWALEYEINSSEFTAQQWATIDSGLSSSDKTKLDGIQAGAEVNVQSDWNVTDSTSDAYIKNKPTIPTIPNIQISGTNIGTVEAGKYIASLSANGHTISAVKASLPTLATVATSGSYNDLLNKPTIPTIPDISVATSGSGNALTGVSVDSSNKHKLNFTTGTFLTAHQDITGKMNTDMSNIAVAGTKADGKTVVWDATNTRWTYGEAGKVDDVKVNNVSVVTNKVANITVPTVNNGTLSIQGNGTTATTFTANSSSSPTLNIKGSGGTTVTKSADNEITISTGTIPTVNNGTLTIKLNGTSKGTFTANQAGNTTIELTDHTYTVNDGTLTIKTKAKSEAESTTTSEVTLGTFTANQSSSPTIKIPIPTKVSDLENDTGFITGLSFNQLSSHPTTLAGYGITDAKIANGVITLGSNTITPITDVSGKADKSSTVTNVFYDNTSSSSTYRYLRKTINGTSSNIVQLATVATSGSYNDLSNKPTIPDISGKADKSTTVTDVFYDNTSSSSTYRYLRKTINGTTSNIVQLATVATSGAYSDLSGQPTKLSQFTNDSGFITTWTTVNNGTLNLQGDGTTVQSFTANASGTYNMNFVSGTKISLARDTTNKKLTVNHSDTTRTDTTSTASPAHGGTFTAVDSVSTDATGHITAVNVKTVTLPADTDTKVAQVLKTDNYDRPLLMSDQVITATTASPVGEARRNNSIYANTSTGKITSTLISSTQVGGITKSYELQATGYKTILQIKDATTYWTTLGGRSHIEFLVEASTIASGTAGTTAMVSRLWRVRAYFDGTTCSAFVESVNQNPGRNNGSLSYIRVATPKNSTSYCPQIAVALYNANAKVYIKATMLEATEGWQFPSSIGGDPGTTNYNVWDAEVGRYNYHWSSLKMATNITGGCDGTAGWANGTWDRLDNDRYYYGEAVVAGSLVALSPDGLMWKLRNTNKTFSLPLHFGKCTGTFAVGANYGRVMRTARGIAYSEFTNATMQGTAFTVPTLASASTTSTDYGKQLYMRGSLDNGNFKPDGTIALSMSAGYTWIPIGKVDYTNVGIATAPSTWTLDGYNANAYTLDSNGKLTHINGKEIKDADTTSIPWNSVTSKPFVSFGDTIEVTNNVANVKLGYSASGKNYAIAKDSSGNLYVNVPWTDNNTDTLMTQNVSTTNATYPILACPTADATANQGAKTGIFASSVELNPSTGNVVFTKATGGISYKGTKATYNLIRFIDNTTDTYGNGIIVGGGGLVVIGAGESAGTIAGSDNGGTEELRFGSDGQIKVYTNVQNNSTTLSTFNADGTFTPYASGTITNGNPNAVTGGTVYSALGSYVPTSRTINSKALSSNISLTASDVGALASNYTYPISLTQTGTATVTLAHNTVYTLTAGGSSVVFKTPTDSNTDTLMTQNVSTGNNTYPILACPTANATANQGAKTGIFSSKVLINPSTGYVQASGYRIPNASTTNSGYVGLNASTTYGNADIYFLSNTSTARIDLEVMDKSSNNQLRVRLNGGGSSPTVDIVSQATNSGAESTVASFTNAGALSLSTSGTIEANNTYAVTGGAVNSKLASYVPTSRTINSKALTANISLTASDVGALASNHTYPISLTQTGTSTITLAHNTTYTLTAGGSSVVFKTPTDNNSLVKQTATASTTTTYPLLFSAQTSPTSGTAYEARYSTNCYVKSNQLYSNGTVVSVNGHTHSSLSGSITSAISVTAGWQLYTGTAITGSSTTFFIETLISGNYGMQRATNTADASNVYIRTCHNKATGTATNWGAWTYAYAVWKP